jgi:hypothetical protein
MKISETHLFTNLERAVHRFSTLKPWPGLPAQLLETLSAIGLQLRADKLIVSG